MQKSFKVINRFLALKCDKFRKIFEFSLSKFNLIKKANAAADFFLGLEISEFLVISVVLVFIVNFEQISHIGLVFPLLTLNK